MSCQSPRAATYTVTDGTTLQPANAEVKSALDRILASALFSRSARLAGFLRFIVNEQLDGRTTSPKEYELGVEVFGRDPNYDPRVDPIVRVQARQLRFKLREYYEGPGREDPIRIEIPKGAYTAEFSFAAPEPAVTAPTPPPAEISLPEPVTPVRLIRPHLRWTRRSVIAVVSLLLAAAVGVLFARWTPGTWTNRQTRVDPVAQDLYLKGKYYWNKRSPESLNKAVDYFTQAIVKDPNYAQAYAGLADCYNLLREYTAMPPSEAWPRAIAAAQKAVELDNSSAEAHSSLGFALFYGGLKIADGEREYRTAIELDPNYAKAHHWYATSLMLLGRYPEALAEIERARQLDPSSTPILADEGYILYYAGQTNRAVALLKQVEEAEPAAQSAHVYLANIHLVQGDYTSYLLELGKAAELSHNQQWAAIWTAAHKGWAASGSRGMLAGILNEQKRLLADNRIDHFEVAKTYLLAGDHEHALDELQAAIDAREMNIPAIPHDPVFAALNGDPRFQQLKNEVKLLLQI